MRILVAGLGNIFLGDDGFGSEVARLLASKPRPAGVVIADFGVRVFDLVCALQADYDAAILVDLVRTGGEPGTISWIDPNLDPAGSPAVFDPHAMDPARALAVLAGLRGKLPRLRLLGCEPARIDEDAFGLPLSAAVAGAVPVAASILEDILQEWLAEADHA
jgi:hydrogenase maturation protease